MVARRPGQYAREQTRRRALRVLGAIIAIVGVAATVEVARGFESTVFIVAEVAALAALVLLDRVAFPIIDRWDRGADGEERVGALIDGLGREGWHAIHDARLERGNIDHILVGPGGVLTVETKSHRGPVAVDRIDERMLKQAYAEAKAVERVTGRDATPLLVFSRAYLDRPVSRRRGVTILPARMLAGHLQRRGTALSAPEIADIHRRLGAALR